MPTYRYECPRCAAVHEIFHSISDGSERECPDCGGKLTRQVGGAGGVILKGSGFHNTDYRSDSYRAAAKKEEAKPKPAAKDKKKDKKAPDGKSKGPSPDA
jgi:putative FmdB family regulatory protein